MSRPTYSSDTDEALKYARRREDSGATLHSLPADYSSESGGGDKMFVHAFPAYKIPVSSQDREKIVAFDEGKQAICEEGKQAIWGEEKQTAWGEDTAKIFSDHDDQQKDIQDAQESHVSRVCGLKKRTFILLIGLVILVVALAAGLGGGLGASHNRSSATASDHPTSTTAPNSIPTTSAVSAEYDIGGSLDPAYYSRFGAWNGTGLTTATSGNETTAFFFQGYQGELRYIIVLKSTVWNVARTLDTQGTQTGITDGKNSTPISVAVYNVNQEPEWHLFYIDRNNQLREKWFNENNHTLDTWHRGTLDAQDLSVFAADTVAMGACEGIQTANGTQAGTNLFFASDNQTLQHYAYEFSTNLWTHQYTFNNINGHGGVACGYQDQTLRLFLTNANHQLEAWVLDPPNNNTDNDSQWTPMTIDWGTASSPTLHPSSSIKLFQNDGTFNQTIQDRVIAQLSADNNLYSYALTYDPKVPTNVAAVQEKSIVEAIPGTHVETTITLAGDVVQYKVFCQIPNGIPDIQLVQTNSSSSSLNWIGFGIFSYADLYSPQQGT